ncbi:MAG: hypothetical protein ACRCSZ_03305, partial [Lactococcus lactis]
MKVQSATLNRFLPVKLLAQHNPDLFDKFETKFLLNYPKTVDVNQLKKFNNDFQTLFNQTLLQSIVKPVEGGVECLTKSGLYNAKFLFPTWKNWSKYYDVPIPPAAPYEHLSPINAHIMAITENNCWSNHYGTLQVEFCRHIHATIDTIVHKLEHSA